MGEDMKGIRVRNLLISARSCTTQRTPASQTALKTSFNCVFGPKWAIAHFAKTFQQMPNV